MAIIDYKNYAFISYQRKDERWAKWLQRKLENFRLPSIYHGDNIDRKYIRPIFRDKTDLTGGVLSEVLKKELRQSRFLIVICSPNSAASKWVDEEITYFMENHSIDAVIPFIVKGEPHSEDVLNECFPLSLREFSHRAEIIGINIKETGRTQAFIRLVAYMLGVRFDELWQRHKRRSIRIFITEAVLCLIIIGFGFALYHHYGDKVENMRVSKLINELSLQGDEPLFQRLLTANTICSKAHIIYNPTFDYEVRKLLHSFSDSSYVLFPISFNNYYPECTKINERGEFLICGNGVHFLDSTYNIVECEKCKKLIFTNPITGEFIGGTRNGCIGPDSIYYIEGSMLWQYKNGANKSLVDIQDNYITDIEYDKYSSSILILGGHYLRFYDIKRNKLSEKVSLSYKNDKGKCSSIESISPLNISVKFIRGKEKGMLIFHKNSREVEFLTSTTEKFHYSANGLFYAEDNAIKFGERVICSCDSKIKSFSIKDNLIATLQDDKTIKIWRIFPHNDSEEISHFTSIDDNGTIELINDNLIAVYNNSLEDCKIHFYKILRPVPQEKVVAKPRQHLLKYTNPNSKDLFWLDEHLSESHHNYRIGIPPTFDIGKLFLYRNIGADIYMFAYDLNGNMACFQNKDSLVVYHNGKYSTIPHNKSEIIDICVDPQSGNIAVLSENNIEIYDFSGEIIASREAKDVVNEDAYIRNMGNDLHKRRILKFDSQHCLYEEVKDVHSYQETSWYYHKNQAFEKSSFLNSLDSYREFKKDYLFVIYPNRTEVYQKNNAEPILLNRTSEIEPLVFGDYIAVTSKSTLSVFHFPSATLVDTIECKENCIKLDYSKNAIFAYYNDGEVISYPFPSYEDNISSIRNLMRCWVTNEW